MTDDGPHTVKRLDLWGVEQDTYATEAEAQGYREEQLALPEGGQLMSIERSRYMHQRVKVPWLGQELTGVVKSAGMTRDGERISLVIEQDGTDRLIGLAATPEQIEILTKEEEA